MSHATVSYLVGGLRMRIAPGLQAKIIDSASPGDVVEVVARLHSGWAYVKFKGQVGYMFGQHLDDLKEEPLPLPPPPPPPDLPDPVAGPPDSGPPAWMYVGGIITIALGFIAAVAIILR